jgi:hypothetical protein
MCLRTFPDFSSQCVYYFSGSEIIWGSNMFGHFFQVAWTQQSNLRSIGLQEQPPLDPYRREVHVTLQKAWCSTSWSFCRVHKPFPPLFLSILMEATSHFWYRKCFYQVNNLPFHPNLPRPFHMHDLLLFHTYSTQRKCAQTPYSLQVANGFKVERGSSSHAWLNLGFFSVNKSTQPCKDVCRPCPPLSFCLSI